MLALMYARGRTDRAIDTTNTAFGRALSFGGFIAEIIHLQRTTTSTR